ncbi:hypothetical protein HNO88_000263 [Novosphingobium chloroacetimidivorans]|uniref:Uncharacterized protein n=1 Tax=Novosphingobium chloroacetimidivorans TaxID=1428314 RepID=A0A7W7K6V1_9SPHN|nr:hypothetical protein [Novosphingobium chloroacetimidivorans]MBB4856966.1 hypothetical protein [Novosphingobium chloroacetimidivorans]
MAGLYFPVMIEAAAPRQRGECRATLWSIAGFWSLRLLVLAAISVASSATSPGVLTRRMGLVVIAATLCYAIHLVLRPVRPRPFWQSAIIAAIKCGDARSSSTTHLRSAAQHRPDAPLLCVKDDAHPRSREVTVGTGPSTGPTTDLRLLNVRQRLATRFAERWSLNAGPGGSRGSRVDLGIPLRYA